MSIPPPAVSYRRTQLVHLPGGAPSSPPYIGNAHAASGRLPSAHSVGASLGRDLCHASFPRHGFAASDNLLLAHLVSESPRRAPCHAFSHRQRPRRLRRYPPASPQLVHSRGVALVAPPSIGTLALYPVIFYRRNLMVHLQEWCRPIIRLPTSSIPTPPPAVSYRRTQMVHLPGGAPVTPLSIGNTYAKSG